MNSIHCYKYELLEELNYVIESTKELKLLYRISQTISSRQQNLADLLKEILRILENETGALRGTLTLRKPGSDILNIEASSGLSNQEIERGQYRLGEGITGRVAKTGKLEIISDISKSEHFLNRTKARNNDHTAFICVPINHHKEVIGTISIDVPSEGETKLNEYGLFLEHVAQILASAVSTIREEIEERNALESENKMLRRQLGNLYSIDNMVGNCNAMRLIYEQIIQVADSTATVLIRGESGTGKELVARAIHFNSTRKNNAFISVNCAALPENLIESELFGHEKGAFTGAQQQRKGRFELANGGTLFLDEIGDISPAIQVRLLRVLQEKTFERVGGNEIIKVNVRVIAATSRNLEEGMQKETFREDLFYRLNVFPIMVPPLRERKSDILLLADHFLQKYGKLYNKPMKRISTSAINMIMVYHWPGNVRELENCIERAALTSSDGVIHGFNLPPTLQTSDETHTNILPGDGADLKQMIETYEREILVDTLKKYRGNAAAVSRYLNTTQRIINYRVKNLGIDPRKYK